jgi:tight adherence protein B
MRQFDEITKDPMTLVTALATFVLVLVVWSMGLLLLLLIRQRNRERLLQRIERSTNGSEEERVLRLWHEGKEHLTTVAAFARVSLVQRVRAVHRDSGISSSLRATLLNLLLVAILVGSGIFFVSRQVVPTLFSVLTVVIGYWWYVQWRVLRRVTLFERQLVDALELASRALRAGHPLLGSFQLISEEIPAPVGVVFGEICQQQAMGIDLQDAIRRLANESQNMDMRLLAASLAINLSCGGNVADVVEGLAAVIRDRMRLNRRFRVLIAQTQFSKRILIAMPVIMFVVLNTINREYMATLYDTRDGNIILLVAAGMLTLGWWSMNKMATLKT